MKEPPSRPPFLACIEVKGGRPEYPVRASDNNHLLAAGIEEGLGNGDFRCRHVVLRITGAAGSIGKIIGPRGQGSPREGAVIFLQQEDATGRRFFDILQIGDHGFLTAICQDPGRGQPGYRQGVGQGLVLVVLHPFFQLAIGANLGKIGDHRRGNTGQQGDTDKTQKELTKKAAHAHGSRWAWVYR